MRYYAEVVSNSPLGRTGPGQGERRAGAPEILGVVATHRCPWGLLHVAASDRGVVAVELSPDTSSFAARVERRLGGPVVPLGPDAPAPMRRLVARARLELDEYFAGTRTAFDVPLDLSGLSAWDRLVLEGARRVPYGRVTSYGGLATSIGHHGAARAVGGAMGRNPLWILVPCHRVIAGDGTLGGYGGTDRLSRAEALEFKRRLLEAEGVEIPA